MPQLPEGDPAPVTGEIPPEALDHLGQSHVRDSWGAYVHVPFCASRCGYCDFNTYTASELGPGVGRDSYPDDVGREIALARRVVGERDIPFDTVFFGGGTPTLLAPEALARILNGLATEFGLAPGAEVTTEANPDSVTPESLSALREAGFTRVSFGMQSAARHVLQVLDRTHTAGSVENAVGWARDAGFEHVNVDLIYGTPGESDGDWARTLDSVLALGDAVDHVSAYSLIVEPGTRLGAQVERGVVAHPDQDAMAERYLMAERALSAAGFAWYEVSNWARPGGECRHNLVYWRNGDWWGFGPGAHSHIGGIRWWNAKHPSTYAQALKAGHSPAAGRETLGPVEMELERVMLGVRLAEGMDVGSLGERAVGEAAQMVGEWIEPDPWVRGRLVLNETGRLMADALVRRLV